MTDLSNVATGKEGITDSLNFTFAIHVLDEIDNIVTQRRHGTPNWKSLKTEHVKTHFYTALRQVDEVKIVDEWKGNAKFLLGSHGVPEHCNEDCISSVYDNFQKLRQTKPGEWEERLYQLYVMKIVEINMKHAV